MVEYRLVVVGDFDIEEHLREVAGWLDVAADVTQSEDGWQAVGSDADFEIQLRESPTGEYRSRYDLPLNHEFTFSDNQELVMQVVDRWIHENPGSFVLLADDRTIAMRRTRAIFFNMDEFIEFDDIFAAYIASDFSAYD